MQAAEALAVLAEVSVAFAGFSGIVTAFRRRNLDEWSPLDRFRLRFMVEFSLVTLLLALIPFFVSEFGVTEDRVFNVCSGPLAAGSIVYLTRSVIQVRRLVASGFPVSRSLAALNFGVGVAIALSSLANTFGWFAHPSAIYLSGVGGCLFVCSAMFARLLLAETAPDAR